MPTTQTHTGPIRVKFTQALEMLSISRPTLTRLINRDVFTVLYPNGSRGRGKRVFLLYAEVMAYGERGEEAVRDLRDKKSAKGRKAGGKQRRAAS